MSSVKKHIPSRTCIACRRIKPKQELIRLVRNSEGKIEVDIQGKKNGRGSYLCREPSCWQTGLEGGKIEYALRTTLTPDNQEQLVKYRREIKGTL